MSDYLSIMITDVLADMLRTEDLSLERPIQPSLIRVPDFVELDGDRLIYSWWGDRETVEHGWEQPRRGILEDFIRLADGPDARILAFAREWGPIHMCEAHELPLSHSVRTTDPLCLSPKVEDRPGWEWEPLSAWRRYAGAALGCLHVAARLRDGRPGDVDDWRRIEALFEPTKQQDDHPGEAPAGWDPVQWQRTYLPHMAQYWLTELAHVNLLFRWDYELGAPGLKLVGERSDLFGALGLQLVFAMSGTGGFVTCSGCGEPYTPKRQPIAGRRHYCRDCGRTAAVRDAQARFRAEHPDYYKARKSGSSGGTAA